MGLSKPIIVNTQEVIVTESAVDLSGIENALATIQADASAAKTNAANAYSAAGEAKTAAQAAETAAGEGGAEGAISVKVGKSTTIESGKSLTLCNISGQGYFDFTATASANFTLALTIDGNSVLSATDLNSIMYDNRSCIKRVPFKESCKAVIKNTSDYYTDPGAFYQITLT